MVWLSYRITDNLYDRMNIIDTMGNNLAKAATIDFGIQWACWAVAALLKTEKFYDLAGKLFFLHFLRIASTFVFIVLTLETCL